jgi:fumarylacetoacetase
MGFVVGAASELGRRISTGRAAEHLFGVVLLNDWSARDIQKWEYQPLGPFLGKSFATTISPWVVPFEALEPFRVPAPPQDPPVLDYLRCEGDWACDIQLEVAIQSERMAAAGVAAHPVTRANFRHMYWSAPQMLAHLTVNGCAVAPGDLFGSGTVSGPTEGSRGSMLELCWKGTMPITLPTGEQRKFIADGDTVLMRGWCEGHGYRIGLGDCRAKVLPAIE